MDFDKLLRDAGKALPTEPSELYRSLPEKPVGYGYLRDVQSQVLAQWWERRDEKDLVLKVNTGSGKTIDGLIILQSHLNAGNGPALYVAPSLYLVEQVRREAELIGIATVDDPDSPKYLGGEAIAVVTVAKLFNGKSVFRDGRTSTAPVPIGAVVIDDAHAALAEARQAMSLSIPVDSAAHGELLALFREDLRQHAPTELLDVEDRSYDALARVPFWSWRGKIDSAREILHRHRNSDQLKFAWPAVKDVLEICRAVFTGAELSITPVCNPTQLIGNFDRAAHRVYLTATLADDSILVTDFGADPDSVAKPITPNTAGDIGERMILAPLELNPGIRPEGVRVAIAKLAETRNVVVIVPSTRIANIWRTYTDKIVYADQVAAVVEQLRAKTMGLVVLVNKYDGIDLPGDACRVLVLDGLPEAIGGDERTQNNLVGRVEGSDERQVQRIEQGMGRGVRSTEDHCVVILMGARLTQLVADPRSFVRFSPATQAQLSLSRAIASGLEGASIEEIVKVAEQALNRDPSWTRYAKTALEGVAPAPGHVTPAAALRRRAFDRAADRGYADASELMSEAAGVVDDERLSGALLEERAAYLDWIDPARAQEVLAAARSRNPSTLRPLSGITYKRLSPSASQAAACSAYLTSTYADNRVNLRLGIEAVLDDLVFDPGQKAAPKFEQAVRDLGLHLGFASERPEKEIGMGPDNLWALGGLQYWVIEAKSGATTDTISKHDISQLSNSVHWFHEQYDASTDVTPVMIHPSVVRSRDAAAPPGTKIITADGLASVRDNVRAMFTALTAEGGWDSPARIDGLLHGHHLRAGDLQEYLRDVRSK